MHAWRESGPNLAVLFQEHPELRNASRKIQVEVRLTPPANGILWLQPGRSGEPPFDYFPTPIDFFIHFVINPKCESLGGPCATCDNFYLMNTRRQLVYCSQACGLRASSRTANMERRKREHADKISAAHSAITNWLKSKTRDDWKSWVERKTFISKHWLTRAERNGELTIPSTR